MQWGQILFEAKCIFNLYNSKKYFLTFDINEKYSEKSRGNVFKIRYIFKCDFYFGFGSILTLFEQSKGRLLT